MDRWVCLNDQTESPLRTPEDGHIVSILHRNDMGVIDCPINAVGLLLSHTNINLTGNIMYLKQVKKSNGRLPVTIF